MEMTMLSLKNHLFGDFKVRSARRNNAADKSRIAAVVAAIDDAIRSLEYEYAGLSRRLGDVRSRAAIVCGNDVYEHLDRELPDHDHLNALEAEMANGDSRLKELSTMIGHFKFLRTAVSERFPDLSPHAHQEIDPGGQGQSIDSRSGGEHCATG